MNGAPIVAGELSHTATVSEQRSFSSESLAALIGHEGMLRLRDGLEPQRVVRLSVINSPTNSELWEQDMVPNFRSSIIDDGPDTDSWPGRLTEAMLLEFLREASLLPGRGPSAMAILLVNQCRDLERHEHILVTPRTLRAYTLQSNTAYRALEQLQSAGLIKVYRRRGQGPTVTILAKREQHLNEQGATDV